MREIRERQVTVLQLVPSMLRLWSMEPGLESVAVALETSGGTISSARVGVTGAGPKAFRLASLEGALAGRPLADALSAVDIADDDVQELNSEIHASAEYRRAMIDVYARRAVQAAVARAGA